MTQALLRPRLLAQKEAIGLRWWNILAKEYFLTAQYSLGANLKVLSEFFRVSLITSYNSPRHPPSAMS